MEYMQYTKSFNKENVFIVLPVFNEDELILKKTVNNLLKLGFNIVIVDDGNPTPIKYMFDYRIFILRHVVNLGQGAALQTGIEFSKNLGGEYFITFDADDQHDFQSIIPFLLELEKKEMDILIGSRFMGITGNMPFIRKIVLKTAIIINYLFTGFWLTDAHNGFRVFNIKGSSVFNFKQNRMAYATELLINLRKVKNVKFTEFQTKVSYSKYSLNKGQKNIDSIKIMKDLIVFKLFGL